MGCAHHGRREFIRKIAEIERMKRIRGPAFPGRVSDHIKRIRRDINHRRGIDSDMRPIVVASERRKHWLAKIRREQHRARIRIDRVNRIIAARDVHHIVRSLAPSGCNVYSRDH